HVLTVDPFRRDDARHRRYVSQWGMRRPARTERDDVADGGKSRHTRAKQLVDRHIAAIEMESEAFNGQPLRHRSSARRHQQVVRAKSEEHTSELQSRENLVCRLLLAKKKTSRTAPSTVDVSLRRYSVGGLKSVFLNAN